MKGTDGARPHQGECARDVLAVLVREGALAIAGLAGGGMLAVTAVGLLALRRRRHGRMRALYGGPGI